MRSLYIATMAAYEAHRPEFSTHKTTHWMALYDPTVPGDEQRWEAAGKPVAVSTEHKDEGVQDRWEANPEVHVLPDPVFEGLKPIAESGKMLANRDNTHNLLHHAMVPQNFGFSETDTTIDLHAKLARWHPAFKLRPLST